MNNENRWVDVGCLLCRDSKLSQHLSCCDRLKEPSLYNFRLTKCEGCGFIYLNPRLSNEYAHEAYSEIGYDPFVSVEQSLSLFQRAYNIARWMMLKWKFNLVSKLVPFKSKVLDIGCGTGEFLNELKNHFTVIGIEPEYRAAEWARSKLGLNVFTGTFDEFKNKDSYDMISMWHVLEHVPDPMNTLSMIKSVLNKDGVLLIAVPNIASYDSKAYGKFWIALDAPRHLWHFTPKTMQKVLDTAGFKIVKQKMMPLDLFYNVLQSESLMKEAKAIGKFGRILTPFRMLKNILLSLMYGMFTQNYSSVLYIVKCKK